MATAGPPGGEIERSSVKVELTISARDLKDLDALSKSDPMCIVYEFVEKHKNWVKIGSTEQIKNNLNPDFMTPICLEYQFERLQKLKFHFIDGDGNGEYDEIGFFETDIGHIMGSRNQRCEGKLMFDKGKKSRGLVIIRGEPIEESHMAAKFEMQWKFINNQVGMCLGFCPEQRDFHIVI